MAAQVASSEGPLKLYVGNLTDKLANITDSELRDVRRPACLPLSLSLTLCVRLPASCVQLFSPFGAIDNVDIHKDPYTGLCRGYAFIAFRNAADAKEAMTAMNGFDISGKQLKVGWREGEGGDVCVCVSGVRMGYGCCCAVLCGCALSGWFGD